VANTTAPVGQILYSGTGVGKYGPSIPLDAGDNGILSIQTVQQSATMTSGVYAIVLYKEIGLPLPLTTLGVPAERDYFNQLPSMPIIPDGACLSLLMLPDADLRDLGAAGKDKKDEAEEAEIKKLQEKHHVS
jgi:hypothetical protein